MSTSPHIGNVENLKKDMQVPPLVLSMAGDGKSNPPSPHQLATMTNVNVLDLHKDYSDATKVYDKETNTVYVYSNNKPTNGGTGGIIEATVVESQSQMSIPGHILNRDAVIDGRAIQDRLPIQQVGEEVTRMVDNSFLQRLVENQEVISREFINGEAHIITRNENGEHVLTRIINPDPKLLADSAIFAQPQAPPPSSEPQHTILHHDKNDNKHHMVYASTDLSKTASDSVKQIIYTHGDKDILYTTNTDLKSGEVYSAINPDGETVIYTTAGNGTKSGLEVYQGSELGMVGEGQVIIPGGLQYTAQQGPNGTTVYVLTEMTGDESGVTR